MHRVLSDIIFTQKPCSPFVSCFTFVVVLYMVYEISGINKSYGTPWLNDDTDNLITDHDLNANLFNNHLCNISKTVCIDSKTVKVQANKLLQLMNESKSVNVAKFTSNFSNCSIC